ncbi:MAG: hypothetical protein AAF497_25830, partial [Planctomycetota bacterium]
NASPGGSLFQWVWILTVGLIGLWIGVATEMGKPILVALNQDVVGIIQSERPRSLWRVASLVEH